MNATDIRIDRLVIHGRPLSASETKRLAHLIAASLAEAPPPASLTMARLSVEPPQEVRGTGTIERLARLVAREIRRSLV